MRFHLLLFYIIQAHAFDKNPLLVSIISQMNFTEKVNMMHGIHGIYVGNIKENSRLKIPSINMQDGPQGFRTTSKTGGYGTSTAWPSALTIASSWDRDLLYRWASAMALEFKNKGANVALSPGIGIARVPTAGRNFEYLCGEDPYLGSSLVKGVIKGIQDMGVIATAKHFINNEIEDDRKRVSANVNKRVRYELYYPPFQSAIEEGVLAVMCSYNRVNDVHACQNNDTLNDLRMMGFSGWVMSDWLATPATVNSLNAGMDQEMPIGIKYSDAALALAIENREVSIEQIDESVYRILSSMYSIGLLSSISKTSLQGDPTANVTSDEHNLLAREIAAKSTILVKNTGSFLPLDATDPDLGGIDHCIAVFGDENTVSGGGSGSVSPPYVITPKEGIDSFIRQYQSGISVIYETGTDLQSSVKLAEKCGVAVVVVATTSTEGSDRPTLSLGSDQDTLVETIASVNPKTIVAVTNPGAVLLPWSTVSSVRSILLRGMPGQENGNALADILFGEVNPFARLPISIPNKDNEVQFTPMQYPGVGEPPEASYNEELLIGYRWYHANDVTPLFPFGFGLSFTTFIYNNLKIQKYTNDKSIIVLVEFEIKNIGERDGSEIAQLYLSFPSNSGCEICTD